MTVPNIQADNIPALSDPKVLIRAIALLSEELIEPHEFTALTCGVNVASVPTVLRHPAMLAEVQKAALQLRTSGEVARLEAARHAREAVQIAASIMRDPDMLASNRLNAATFIAKASGTERPPTDAGRANERHTITINIGGDRPPIIVESGDSNSVPTMGENTHE